MDPNVALAPLSHQLSTSSIAHQNSLKSSNDKHKSRKDKVNSDEDSLSSTTTFSSENSNLSGNCEKLLVEFCIEYFLINR
jgi:hypothetical protein